MFEGFITFFFVGFIILVLTGKLYLALLFGALASATAPAGTAAVFWEFDCKGALTTTTMLILALDDILAIILTDFALDYTTIELSGLNFDIAHLLLPMILDVVLSVGLGLTAGIILSIKLNREEEHGEYVDLLIGAILVCIGLAGLLEISYILPTMVFGVTIASLCKRPAIDPEKRAMIVEVFGQSNSQEMIEAIDKELLETRQEEPHQIFREVYKIASPIVALFFVLIGLNLEVNSLAQIGLIGLIYLLGRTFAKTVGAFIGATVVHATKTVKRYLGPCLYSQAGVALGLAVLIAGKLTLLGFPEEGLLVLNTITATTVIFQVFGPVAIKWAIGKSGEARR
ncbi:MAG: cation:proton antiporter [Candidatus Hodarchaeales archaeon]